MIYGLPNSAQFAPLAGAVAIGLFCGLLWDILRVFRKLRVPGRVRLFIEDVSFCLIAALLFFSVCCLFNYGKVRGYILLAQVLGFSVWYLLPGRLADRTASAIQKLLRTFVLRPIVRIYRLYFALRKCITSKRKQRVRKMKKKQKKSKKNYFKSAKNTCK